MAVCCRLGFLALIAAGVAGCGRDGRCSVSGKVTLDGEAVTGGFVRLEPIDGTKGSTAGATINKDGAYYIAADQGPAPGNYRVQISWAKPTGKKVPAGSPFPPGAMRDETKEAFRAEFNTQSKLHREVKPGANTFDFDLK